jgi:type IV secretory pathway VirB10-like protein
MGADALRSIRILLGVGVVGAALTFAYVNNFFDGLIEALRGERQLAEASVSDPSSIAESLQGVFSGGDIDPLLDEVFLEPLPPSAEFNQAANGSGQTADTTNTEDDTQSLLGEEAQAPEASSAGESVLADATTPNSSVPDGQVNPPGSQETVNTTSDTSESENAKDVFLVPGTQGTSNVAADAEVLPEPRRQAQNGTTVGGEGDWQAQLIDAHTKRLFEAVLEREFNAVQDQKDREQLADRGPLGQSLYGVNEGRQQDDSGANSTSTPTDSTTTASAHPQPDNISIAPGVPYSPNANSGSGYGKTLTAGSLIPAVLVDDINSELPGLVRAMVVRDVYDSDTLEHLMIPRGSTLLGSYENQTANNQSRLFVYWTQLRLPNGRTVDLERAAAVDTNGAVGLTGRRSNGFAKSVLQATLLNLASNAARGGAAETSPSDIEKAAQIALGQSLGSVAEQRLEQSLSQGVRFRIPAGTNFNVQIKNDFEISGTSLRPSSTRFADADTKDGASSSGMSRSMLKL